MNHSLRPVSVVPPRGFTSLVLILVVLAIALVIGTGWWATRGIPTTLNQAVGETATTTQQQHAVTTATTSASIQSSDGLQTYTNAQYGFSLIYPKDMEVVFNPYPDKPEYIAVFNPSAARYKDVVVPKLWVWKAVPKYGPVSSIDELEKALAAFYAPDTLHFSIVESGGFTFVQVDGIPGLVGEPSAFALVPYGVLGIYGSDSIIGLIHKL